MYSSKKNVLLLVSLLKQFDISQVVISPGSRNSPIVHSLAADPFFRVHTVVDERSAGFYAIGLILATGKTAAVCCTSGSAVLNLAPSIAEACYQQLPLLAITADRPPQWIGQMDGQTIPQPGVFNTLVRKSVQLPEIDSAENQWYCNRLINEALLELDHRQKGPVHINIPLSEPLFDFSATELPETRRVSRVIPDLCLTGCLTGCPAMDGYARRFSQYSKVMILVGQHQPDPALKLLLQKMAEHGCAVLAESLSNLCPTGGITNFDALLYALPPERYREFAPELLITLGGHVVSKRIKQYLRSNPAGEHWDINSAGELIDLHQCLTDIIQAPARAVLDYLFTQDDNNNSDKSAYGKRWRELSSSLPRPQPSYSDLAACGLLLGALPQSSTLHLANSSTVRLAQLFAPVGNTITVCCNRGTSGIEGSLSTATGYAAASPDKPVFLIIGDLSFFYDMNGLWNPQLGANLRILLNNNGGGELFHVLPGLNSSSSLNQHISAQHSTSARAWAESLGLEYLTASNQRELESGMAQFTNPAAANSILFEVFSDIEDNTAIYRDYYHQLKQLKQP